MAAKAFHPPNPNTALEQASTPLPAVNPAHTHRAVLAIIQSSLEALRSPEVEEEALCLVRMTDCV